MENQDLVCLMRLSCGGCQVKTTSADVVDAGYERSNGFQVDVSFLASQTYLFANVHSLVKLFSVIITKTRK
ncbi:hypothetical protein [Pantoea sp.]|uniref:hypothetical protein n=1 Tax=Pantoea sp. TaxID=69393 RepID=UPI0028AA99FA|nr:hypothetical protein [Pantoea sp.]